MSEFRGDDHLSGVDRKLWMIVHDVLHRWQTLVIFKYQMINVPAMKSGLIHFFVPADAPERFEIVQFLEHELEKERLKPEEDWPGVDVEITACVDIFSGLEPYLTRDESEKLAEKWVKQFFEMMKRKGKDPNAM